MSEALHLHTVGHRCDQLHEVIEAVVLGYEVAAMLVEEGAAKFLKCDAPGVKAEDMLDTVLQHHSEGSVLYIPALKQTGIVHYSFCPISYFTGIKFYTIFQH